jgi:hypothetical protein
MVLVMLLCLYLDVSSSDHSQVCLVGYLHRTMVLFGTAPSGTGVSTVVYERALAPTAALRAEYPNSGCVLCPSWPAHYGRRNGHGQLCMTRHRFDVS